MGYFRKVS